MTQTNQQNNPTWTNVLKLDLAFSSEFLPDLEASIQYMKSLKDPQLVLPIEVLNTLLETSYEQQKKLADLEHLSVSLSKIMNQDGDVSYETRKS